MEVGGHHGHTTRVLSAIFGRVIVLEKSAANLAKSRARNEDRKNVFYLHMDAYSRDWVRIAGTSPSD